MNTFVNFGLQSPESTLLRYISTRSISDLSIHLLFCHWSTGKAIPPLQKIGTLPDNKKRWLAKIFWFSIIQNKHSLFLYLWKHIKQAIA